MPKTFPIRLEVEEIALGSVLRKLNEMPGVVKLDLNLGRGGEGAARRQLEHHAAERGSKANYEQAVIALLMQGPKHIRELGAALGGKVQRAYNVMTQLRKQGLSEKGPEPGTHQLTKAAREQLKRSSNGNGAAKPLALPAPSQVKHGPSGRAAPGSSVFVLRAALNDGPQSPSHLRAKLVMSGLSGKGVSGVLFRGKRDGFIKKVGDNYELTAKGHKIELGAQHG